MALLLCSDGLTSTSSIHSLSSSSLLSLAVTHTPISRLPLKPINLLRMPSFGVCFCPPIAANRGSALIINESSDIPDGGDAPSESDGEDFLLNELPLDAKLQNKLEQKLRMKVAKKIRLRRKKLVHKRRLRKKGRWPPSKMKKLSNF